MRRQEIGGLSRDHPVGRGESQRETTVTHRGDINEQPDEAAYYHGSCDSRKGHLPPGATVIRQPGQPLPWKRHRGGTNHKSTWPVNHMWCVFYY